MPRVPEVTADTVMVVEEGPIEPATTAKLGAMEPVATAAFGAAFGKVVSAVEPTVCGTLTVSTPTPVVPAPSVEITVPAATPVPFTLWPTARTPEVTPVTVSDPPVAVIVVDAAVCETPTV